MNIIRRDPTLGRDAIIGSIIIVLALGFGIVTFPVHEPTAVPTPVCTITLNSFQSLGMGTSYEDAVRILGCKGDEVSRTDIAGLGNSAIYTWHEPKTTFPSVTVMFSNDKLISKSQFGLSQK
jgi:hypothetical protein